MKLLAYILMAPIVAIFIGGCLSVVSLAFNTLFTSSRWEAVLLSGMFLSGILFLIGLISYDN